MTRIPINVIVIDEVVSDASLDRQISSKVISYCETCGGIVFYQIVEFNYEESKHATDTCIYCAQCGQLQGGIILDPLEEVQSGTAITTAEYEKLRKKAEKLEAVREFVLSRREDIESDMENYGMLRPVLNYFLEEAEHARPEGKE